ncbi:MULTISPECIES: MarR family winged helix-turn-helix transcriptional regulator [unclassified Janthinobacterium]|uniref:MarR family winged helix-turn-helix transcriptional regulator n=1 Tax=unclassified Janthinobacterium TaxID=2610881 RepID=UPI001609D435|nr:MULTISPECIES: MarR family transcriptional regulator [unclassified Janthinobacterium]MBB5367490.1 DNA-binding MarR family transcriptional regulator [Janthinobacterium sp. K2C7]MBB5380032.1 DNA-binding MarR family transcriptional regulator [Janthinobacterium sp. K2Li3]MBB5385872.1 DNA-binding MarR family transcriptional regulator [Janthinobacterium sp. K2E3]
MNSTNNEYEHEQVLHLAGELRILVGKLRRRLREEGHMGDISMSQASVLGWLERDGPATVSSLARVEGMRPQSMSAIVLALSEAQMVTGAPDPQDGRQTIWSLTDTCRAWIRESRAAREDWLAHNIESRLTADEVNELNRAVALLKRLAQ